MSAKHPGPTWYTLGLLALGFIVGAVFSDVLGNKFHTTSAEILGIVLGSAALWVAIVGFFDARELARKIDEVRMTVGQQDVRLTDLHRRIGAVAAGGGGTLVIPPNTTVPTQ